MKEIQINEVKINDNDYIRYISGIKTDGIDFLKFETNEGATLKAGRKDIIKKHEEFRIEIKSTNKLVCLFGTLDFRPCFVFIFCKYFLIKKKKFLKVIQICICVV